MRKQFLSFLNSRIIGKHKLIFILSILCSIIRSLTLLVPSILSRYIIDTGVMSGNWPTIVKLSLISIAIPFITGSLIILDLVLNKYILLEFSNLRTDLYENLLFQHINAFSQLRSGDITFRFVNETDALANFFYFGIGNLVWINTTVITGIALMLYQDWKTSLLVVILLFLRMIATAYAGKDIKVWGRENHECSSRISSFLKEQLTCLEVVKACAKESDEISTFSDALTDRLNTVAKLQLCADRINVIKGIIDIIANCLFYLGGALLIYSGNITIGMLYASIAVYTWILPAIDGYINLHIDFSRNIGAINRVFSFWSNTPFDRERSLIPHGYSIEFRNVSFAYPSASPIIKGFDFSIEMGKKVLITGPSGCGKSTIIQLISNIQSCSSGTIFVGGVPIEKTNEKWIRENIITVCQDGMLFNDTIKNNILFGALDYNPEQFGKILRITRLTKLISSLPDGLNTQVGEHGVKLSGGERQRILLARGLLRSAKIYLLDESTSALDTKTERAIISDIIQEYKDCTFIVVAHRTGIKSQFDSILTLKDGCL